MHAATVDATPPAVLKGRHLSPVWLHHKGLNWFTSVASLTGNNYNEVVEMEGIALPVQGIEAM